MYIFFSAAEHVFLFMHVWKENGIKLILTSLSHETHYFKFLVSERDLACQQEVSLALIKIPPIHYYNVVDSAFSNYAG